MILDIRTIVVMLVLSSILMAIALAVGTRAGRANGFGKWSLGLGLFALGWLLVAARGAMPEVLTMAAADALLFAGLCLHLAAVTEFGGKEMPAGLLYLPGPALFAATLPVLQNYTAFTFVVSLSYAAAFVAIAARALRAGERAGAAHWMLAVTYAACGIGLAAPAGAMLVDPAAYPGLFVESTMHSLAFLSLFATTTAGSVAFLLMLRERAEAEIRHLAMFDPMTEVFNRRAFMELAERELARARRTGAPFAVLMMDLDLFKRVNDQFGHQAGDRVLVEFAAALKRNVRTADLVGRYGGEEFCAILPGASMPKALEVANRIRSTVAARPLAALPRATTVSIGAAVCSKDARCTLDAAIARADEALYRAKREGRDRVVGLDIRAGENVLPLAAAVRR
jgi:diguanylate cyclase (GGDEF)-like protein